MLTSNNKTQGKALSDIQNTATSGQKKPPSNTFKQNVLKSPTNSSNNLTGNNTNANKSGTKDLKSEVNAKLDAKTIKYIEDQKIDSTKKKLEMELQSLQQ